MSPDLTKKPELLETGLADWFLGIDCGMEGKPMQPSVEDLEQSVSQPLMSDIAIQVYLCGF